MRQRLKSERLRDELLRFAKDVLSYLDFRVNVKGSTDFMAHDGGDDGNDGRLLNVCLVNVAHACRKFLRADLRTNRDVTRLKHKLDTERRKKWRQQLPHVTAPRKLSLIARPHKYKLEMVTIVGRFPST